MTHIDATPPTPEPVPPARQEPAAPPEAKRDGNRDSVVLIALLTTCAIIYLAVGDTGFAGVISAVAGLYGTWRMRR
ncbi:hypothetical protein [Streptomyces sp. NPDC059979]|uniref:hypothetical protein n=1 Tax=Streptomyces sp. NPDC059979 TaxID=3347021 RepID=UPI003698437B